MEMKGGSDWLELMIGTAKEELERLESNHPNQFEFFKVELKSFISLHKHHQQQHPPLSTSTIATQASTSGMKRKNTCFMEDPTKVEVELEAPASGMKWKEGCFGTVKRDKEKKRRKRVKVEKEDERVEVALERAKACLQKIHELKTHLLYP